MSDPESVKSGGCHILEALDLLSAKSRVLPIQNVYDQFLEVSDAQSFRSMKCYNLEMSDPGIREIQNRITISVPEPRS